MCNCNQARVEAEAPVSGTTTYTHGPVSCNVANCPSCRPRCQCHCACCHCACAHRCCGCHGHFVPYVPYWSVIPYVPYYQYGTVTVSGSLVPGTITTTQAGTTLKVEGNCSFRCEPSK